MTSFITGSRAYGRPTPGSDIDLVVRVTPEEAERLRSFSDDKNSCRFGRLNLILCETDEQWAVWRVATTRLVLAPGSFNRDQAKEVLDVLREMIQEKDKADSGGEKK